MIAGYYAWVKLCKFIIDPQVEENFAG